MTQAWITLTSVDGRDIAAPTEQQLKAVLSELYACTKHPGKESEPASAALKFGYADGLMYVAEVSSTGELRFEEWSDRDCEMALAQPRRMRAGQKLAALLWSLMASRQVSKIRELGWA